MKIPLWIVITATILAIYACSQKKDGSIGEVRLNFSAAYTCYACDSTAISLATDLWEWRIMKDNIVFFSPSSNELCKVYSYPQLTEIGYIGRKGKSKDEFINGSWCKMKNGEIGLYDVTKGRLTVYGKVGNGIYKPNISYALPKDKDRVTMPYTRVMQYDDSLFLMKSDGETTELTMTDLSTGKSAASYHCSLRDGKNMPYTPYDYMFDAIDGKILIAYSYLDRLELIDYKDGDFVPESYCGEKDFADVPEDYNQLKYCNLQVDTYQGSFYVLRSSAGGEDGDLLLKLNPKTGQGQSLKLDRKIKMFGFDSHGNLLGYNETEAGAVVYRFRAK